jgi:hypothetical protein
MPWSFPTAKYCPLGENIALKRFPISPIILKIISSFSTLRIVKVNGSSKYFEFSVIAYTSKLGESLIGNPLGNSSY